MLLPLPPRPARRLLLATLGSLLACTGRDPTAANTTPVSTMPQFAKTAATSATSVTLTSVSPDSGALSTTMDVQVNGNNFANGMIAIWQLATGPDSTQIKTNSTRFINSKQVIANITITSTATSGQWDVAMYSGGKTGIGSELGVLKNAFKVTDPTATWTVPLNDAGLAIRSDHLYSDGTNSVYANGVCKVSTTIFATTQLSNSGDATLNTGSKGQCIRHFTFVYPDGVTETIPLFSNLRDIENTTYSIPIGSTVERQLHMGTDGLTNVSSRCGGLIWGYGVANNIAAGSDSVLVTRVDASTWHVVSQPAPANLAYCKNTGQLFAMSVDFTVISSHPLP